jgi:hypothetical protein
MVVSNVEKTLSVVMELPLVPGVLKECFLPQDQHQKKIVNMVNVKFNIELIYSKKHSSLKLIPYKLLTKLDNLFPKDIINIVSTLKKIVVRCNDVPFRSMLGRILHD